MACELDEWIAGRKAAGKSLVVVGGMEFWNGEALGDIDAGVVPKEIGEDASGGDVKPISHTAEF